MIAAVLVVDACGIVKPHAKELLGIMESKPLPFVVAQPERVRHDLAQLVVSVVRDGGSGVHVEGAAEEVMIKSNGSAEHGMQPNALQEAA